MIRGDKSLYTPSLQGVLHLLVTVILTIIVTAFISSTPPYPETSQQQRTAIQVYL